MISAENSLPRTAVVVGVDGSASSLAALAEADTYARLLDADLRCVTAWIHVSYEDVMGVYDPEKTAEEIAQDSLHRVFGGDIPTRVTSVIRYGSAGATLVAESEGATLLVVGTRGHTAIGGLLVGSVSTYCAEHALCPVLTVRAPEDRDVIDAATVRSEEI
jgi:nucleotide-binding universal stress UspA family protein